MARIKAESEKSSRAVTDPIGRIAGAALLQAVRDLSDPDPLRAVDALIFWINPDGGAVWLDALGIGAGGDPDRVFRFALKGGRYAKQLSEPGSTTG